MESFLLQILGLSRDPDLILRKTYTGVHLIIGIMGSQTQQSKKLSFGKIIKSCFFSDKAKSIMSLKKGFCR